ncbi:N-carbamoylsarcosine amidohydrolase [Acinetobacter boissieri]|uniref:Maleamate amidohydrolase n=1 Tax=Acinetobacter boissieri TaxID=1219383 RepID=A0A1G6JQH4_9GAMM|nr:N-carbamoylsarcosine amidohydrolase [Acinetobacter boissieri]SDC21000.1 maleamate amidohydrolase [Acinetobacter boissieri]
MTQDHSAVENYKGVWGNRIGYGKKPALILIDFMQGYTTQGEPLYAEAVVKAVKKTQAVLEMARQKNLLVIHTNIRYHQKDQVDGGIWVKKSPVMRAMVEGNPAAEFCEEVQPLKTELVLTKNYASSFFGTSLASTLYSAQVDTVILVGCSTSGCVRATAVDAVQHGFRTIVLRECVGDRHEAPHEANLFDIDSKYGDVVSIDNFYEYLNKI